MEDNGTWVQKSSKNSRPAALRGSGAVGGPRTDCTLGLSNEGAHLLTVCVLRHAAELHATDSHMRCAATVLVSRLAAWLYAVRASACSLTRLPSSREWGRSGIPLRVACAVPPRRLRRPTVCLWQPPPGCCSVGNVHMHTQMARTCISFCLRNTASLWISQTVHIYQQACDADSHCSLVGFCWYPAHAHTYAVHMHVLPWESCLGSTLYSMFA